MTDQSAVDALRAALVLLDAHSLIDPEDGNYRVEGGTWEAVRAALAASATDEGPDCGITGCVLRPGHRGDHLDVSEAGWVAQRARPFAASATDEDDDFCPDCGNVPGSQRWNKVHARPAVPATDEGPRHGPINRDDHLTCDADECGASWLLHREELWRQRVLALARPAVPEALDVDVCLRHRMLGFIAAVPGCDACRAAALSGKQP